MAEGDRVAVMALNSVPHIEAMAAVLRVGAICVPVNFRIVADEVAYVLTNSGLEPDPTREIRTAQCIGTPLSDLSDTGAVPRQNRREAS